MNCMFLRQPESPLWYCLSLNYERTLIFLNVLKLIIGWVLNITQYENVGGFTLLINKHINSFGLHSYKFYGFAQN